VGGWGGWGEVLSRLCKREGGGWGGCERQMTGRWGLWFSFRGRWRWGLSGWY